MKILEQCLEVWDDHNFNMGFDGKTKAELKRKARAWKKEYPNLKKGLLKIVKIESQLIETFK